MKVQIRRDPVRNAHLFRTESATPFGTPKMARKTQALFSACRTRRRPADWPLSDRRLKMQVRLFGALDWRAACYWETRRWINYWRSLSSGTAGLLRVYGARFFYRVRDTLVDSTQKQKTAD